MKTYQFSVFITQDDDGMYLAKVPELKGCHTQAKSIPVLYKRIQEAVELFVEVQKMKKHAVPQERFVGVQQVQVNT